MFLVSLNARQSRKRVRGPRRKAALNAGVERLCVRSVFYCRVSKARCDLRVQIVSCVCWLVKDISIYTRETEEGLFSFAFGDSYSLQLVPSTFWKCWTFEAFFRRVLGAWLEIFLSHVCDGEREVSDYL